MSPVRARNGFGQWVLIAVLLVVLVFAPSVVARSVTSPSEPVEFMRSPLAGWSFAGIVLRESLRADAASPGEALTTAQRRWDGSDGRLEATRVELLYLPHSVKYHPGRSSDAAVDPESALAWQVFGRDEATDRERLVGVLDFTSGEFLWDAERSTGRASAAPTATGKEQSP